MALHVRGVVLPDDEVRDLWVVDDRVTYEPVPGATTVAPGGFILPGLVDAHCHLGIRSGGAAVTSLEEAREVAMIDRATGVLALRDAGSPYPYPELDDEPALPRLARAGRHLASPRRYLRDVAVEVTASDLSHAVAEQAAAGNGWVKLVGDWIDRDRGDLAPSWDDAAAVAAAIEVAHAAGVRVAAHLFAEESVAALVRAGVDSVEHGTGLNEDDIAEMARRGTALVPTLINIDRFDEFAAQGEKFPAYAAHMRRLGAGFASVIGAAHEAGVPIYVGTDAGGGISHGRVVDEMLRLRESGLSTMEVLRAGSWGARGWLGFPGLVEGGLADLVVYDEDPRLDLRVLRVPRLMVLRGSVLGPGGVACR
jgi:imidazolonepropionase-like amidohydrolase